MAARIVTGLDTVDATPSVVTIGLFDGVHRGHQSIIDRAVGRAREAGLRSVVVTFDRHPMEVIRPGSQPKLLMTLSRRAETLAAQYVDLVVVIPFDDEVRHLAPEGFVDRILTGPLEARHVVVGSNFRFGHKAAGDVPTLKELGSERGFTAEGLDLFELGETPISSTEIRASVEAGDVERAAGMLGRPHVVDGVVVRGDRRGAAMGYPTANLQVDPRLAVPARGVYAGVCHLPDSSVPCATSVGVNPTFGGQELRVEAHLLDYSGDLYGLTVGIDFRHRIRGEERFDGVDALVTQMHADVRAVRELLGV